MNTIINYPNDRKIIFNSTNFEIDNYFNYKLDNNIYYNDYILNEDNIEF